MKLQLISSAALAAALISAPAFAQTATAPSNYVQGNVGVSVAGAAKSRLNINGVGGETDIGLDDGLFLSGAVGHDFGNGLSLEAEGVYTHNNANSDDANTFIGTSASTRTFGGLANVKYAFHTGWHNVAPYIGGGVGYGQTRIHISQAGSDSDSGFMWQGKAGLELPVGPHTTFDLGYRYLDLPNYKGTYAGGGVAGDLKVNPHVHVVSIGARFNF